MKRAFLYSIIAFIVVYLSIIAALKINNEEIESNNENFSNIVDFNMKEHEGVRLVVGTVMNIEAANEAASVVNVSINKVNGEDDLIEYIFAVNKETILVDGNLNKVTLFDKLNIGDKIAFFHYTDEKVNEEKMKEIDINKDDELINDKENKKTAKTEKVTNKVYYALVAVYKNIEEGCFVNYHQINNTIQDEDIIEIKTNDEEKTIKTVEKAIYKYPNEKANFEKLVNSKIILCKYDFETDEEPKNTTAEKILIID